MGLHDRVRLRGKVAVVTGGASGIGYALASKCLREGMQLLLSDVNEGLLRSAAETLSQKHQCEIETLVVDVRDEKQVRALLDRCMEKFNCVNLFFNNAGVIGEPCTGVLNTPLPAWRWVLDTNVMGLVNGAQIFVEAMEKQGGDCCHLINTASGAGLYSQHRPTMGPYVASKHCAVVLTQAIKTELDSRGSNVKVHLLCPSLVASDLIPNSQWCRARLVDGVAEPVVDVAAMDDTSEAFHKRLNRDGMSAETVAELTFQGVLEDRFFLMTHPNITLQRIEARFDELRQAISQQPTTGF